MPPTPAFAATILDVTLIALGHRFGRIYHQHYPDPLGHSKARSRFSDPRRRREDHRFGVLYLGSTLKCCFVEAVLRDRRDGMVGDSPIEDIELVVRRYAELVVTASLRVVDLRGDGPIRMGIPSDVLGGTRQTLARSWSVALHDHPSAPDGIIYPSRLNQEANLAIHDRAIRDLTVDRISALIAAPGFADVLNALNVSLA